MADLCSRPCACVPHENICCCPPKNGITVIQPACQVIPDPQVAGKTVVAANPCFCELAGQSYWTYKFTTDCEQNTKGISSIAILVCLSLIHI